jgi:hypothetical protein
MGRGKTCVFSYSQRNSLAKEKTLVQFEMLLELFFSLLFRELVPIGKGIQESYVVIYINKLLSDDSNVRKKTII